MISAQNRIRLRRDLWESIKQSWQWDGTPTTRVWFLFKESWTENVAWLALCSKISRFLRPRWKNLTRQYSTLGITVYLFGAGRLWRAKELWRLILGGGVGKMLDDGLYCGKHYLFLSMIYFLCHWCDRYISHENSALMLAIIM